MPKKAVADSEESGCESDGGMRGAFVAKPKAAAVLEPVVGQGKMPARSASEGELTSAPRARQRSRQGDRQPARSGSRQDATGSFSTGLLAHVGIPSQDDEELELLHDSGELLKTLLKHIAFQSAEIAKLSAAVKNQQDMLQHFATQMAQTSGNTRFTEMPPVYDPRDGLPVPGVNEPHQRDMHPREESDLARKIFQLEKVDRSKRDGMRRIIDPDNEYDKRQCPVTFATMDTCTKWKLWHYVMNPEKNLREVLTSAELSASRRARGQSNLDDAQRPLPLTQSTAHKEHLAAQSKSSDARVLQNAVANAGMAVAQLSPSPAKRPGDGAWSSAAPSATVARHTEGRASPRSNMGTPAEIDAGATDNRSGKLPVAVSSREGAAEQARRNTDAVRPQPTKHSASPSLNPSRAGSNRGSPTLFLQG